MKTGPEQDRDGDRDLRPDDLPVGDAEEREQADHERGAHARARPARRRSRSGRRSRSKARLPLDHALPRCAPYACTSAVISVYPADTTSERNRFWSQIPPEASMAGNVSPTPGIGTT